ncbi:hypothetical protein HPB47_028228 [Ixodes persulcatus]|uniref:Uncharacterized protein n=1 Tax=Ixodes persulcatus TaxID=34615 RepID=A0AC60PVK4_IXOPE|nr:hypothetical protein HPB47_028228 [Ixodes persulcatus]
MPGELCCAVGCSNNTGGNHSVSYHRFPGESHLRLQWTRAVRRENWTPTNSSRLCSEHFTADSYEGTTLLKLEFGLASCNRRLKRGSVPTLFKHTEPRRPPIERGAAIKRKRSQLVDDAMREAAASDQGVSTDPVMDVNDDSAEVSAETDLVGASSIQPDPGQIYEKKFLVFKSCLMELLSRCPQCGAPNCTVSLAFVGTMVRASIKCPELHTTTWRSQPVLNKKPMGNIAMCCAVLFSGSSPTKVLRLFSFMGIQSLQKSQYFKFQRSYLLPAVSEVWLSEQASLLDGLRGRKLSLAGDGRCDTPGHSADFGTYTLMETSANRVIHLELVKSTEVSSSNRMEVEGLERALNYLKVQDMSVEVLVTDRHSEAKAAMKKNHPEIKHRFDVWHVAKGVKKKVAAAAQTAKHRDLLKWLRTIVRHIYWCARTSEATSTTIPTPSIQSVATLSSTIACGLRKQTFGLESFHGILIHFAPKSSKLTYEGMQARTYIAAIHYNHNADREVMLDEDGNPKFRQQCSKAEKRWTVKPVKEMVTYGYVRKLVDAVLECNMRWPSYAVAEEALYRQTHSTLGSRCGAKPTQEEAIEAHRSRFKSQP